VDEKLVARLGAPIGRPSDPLPRLGGKPEHGHEDALTSTREVTYRGHQITITTTYSITVDGEPLEAHVEVDALGRVHYHGLPNYNFASAVDMVETIIEGEPAAFSQPGGPSGHPDVHPPDPHGGHDHGGR
jgi:hypothetical protein